MSEIRSGTIIAGKYRLEGALARGGMGSVWEARHLGLDTRVAIKFIGPDVFRLQEARRRFEREAKAAAFLKSTHVVQIHDYGVEGDLPYLVMELLTGEDLGERLRRRERLSPRETASIVTQVARALRRAADAGIVHRDLKPSNVFIVAGEDDEELVKVLDFGIAKAPRLDTTEQTGMGAIIGSPRYMSPEQARASPLVDPRSDLWSLAVIAYRAITGVYPFDSTEMTDLIVKICTETPTPPSVLDPSLDPEVDAFFVRALARDPGDRFQTAREMAAAFSLAIGEPPSSMTSRNLLVTMLPNPPSRPSSPSTTPVAPPRPPPVRRQTPPAFAATKLSAQPPVAVAPPAASGRASSPSPTPAEPAASRRFGPRPSYEPVPSPEPELSLTTYPDMIPTRTPTPVRRALARRFAAGGAVLVLATGALLLLRPWERSRIPTAASSSAAVPEAHAPPIAPTSPELPGTASAAVPASAAAPPAAVPPAPLPPTTSPEPPPAPTVPNPQSPKRAPAPWKSPTPGKRHPVLGI